MTRRGKGGSVDEVLPPQIQEALDGLMKQPMEVRRAAARSLITEGESSQAIMRYLERWKPLSELGEVFERAPPRRMHLIEEPGLNEEGEEWTGIMPLGNVAMLTSAGGSGKTMAALQLALAVATETKWLGKYRTRHPGHALIVTGEEPEEEVRRRLYDAGRAMSLTPAQHILARQRITVMAMEGEDVALLDNEHRPAEFLDFLQMELRANNVEWRLLVLDPLSRFAGGDTEVDNHAATKFVRAVESLLQAPGRPTVLLTHHTNKSSRQADKPKASASDARGATGLTDGVRWVANLTREDGDLVRLDFTKSNYTKVGQWTQLVRVEGGALQVETAVQRTLREKKQAETEAEAEAKKKQAEAEAKVKQAEAEAEAKRKQAEAKAKAKQADAAKPQPVQQALRGTHGKGRGPSRGTSIDEYEPSDEDT